MIDGPGAAPPSVWLTSLDPGEKQGWAVFVHSRLIGCGLGPMQSLMGRVVVECPQVYPGDRKIDPNDLIVLARRVGRIEEQAARAGIACQVVLPREWKGQTPKETHGPRILRALSDHERGIYMAACEPFVKRQRKKREIPEHNILDAIGIGLWALGRMAV